MLFIAGCRAKPLLEISNPNRRSLFCALALVFESRADPEAAGTTPLMLAAASGEEKQVEEFIANGAAMDQTDARGRTEICHAVDARKSDVLAVLLKKGRNAARPIPAGARAIVRAFKLDDRNRIQPILGASRANLGWTKAARSSFIKAITRRAADRGKASVGSHRLPPKVDGSRHPLLAHTILRGDAETTALLLNGGRNPNTRIGSPADPEFTDRVRQKFIRLLSEERPRRDLFARVAWLRPPARRHREEVVHQSAVGDGSEHLRKPQSIARSASGFGFIGPP
ncbi:MAG: ankyrin repeat domain-containing protein [Chthoniobacteraceae bacterium]